MLREREREGGERMCLLNRRVTFKQRLNRIKRYIYLSVIVFVNAFTEQPFDVCTKRQVTRHRFCRIARARAVKLALTPRCTLGHLIDRATAACNFGVARTRDFTNISGLLFIETLLFRFTARTFPRQLLFYIFTFYLSLSSLFIFNTIVVLFRVTFYDRNQTAEISSSPKS